jgi:hypothetical protein
MHKKKFFLTAIILLPHAQKEIETQKQNRESILRKLETTTKVKEQQNKERTFMRERLEEEDAEEGGDGTTELKDGLARAHFSLCFCVCH